ncbi:MAG: hypothetical protein M3444_02985 [Acidobacteriota bacterium]|nr:hypothetical protein [Acidobacteriota bacterium]MDQ5835241.1 hypothetical protein [Acidobacteriota bacterium]
MTTKIRTLILLTLVAALLGGCKRAGAARLHVIYVIDLTASTVEEARGKAFEGVREAFDKRMVKRGDSVTVIPVTGDALVESQGAILRFDVPATREVYDEDLRELSDDVVDKLQKMQTDAAAKPYAYSDVLGAIRVADEEFAADKPDVRKLLVVLSDFVEDEKQLSFKTSPVVASEKAAAEGAKKMAAPSQALKGAQVYLGWMQSTDLRRMPPQRREAVKTFWVEFFKQAGAGTVHVCSDGSGQLAKFIAD